MDGWVALASGWVGGRPAGQPRGRHVRGRVVSWAAAGAAVRLWRAALERELRTAAEAAGDPLEGLHGGGRKIPLRVDLRFVFWSADPKRHGTPHTAKPDKDNLEKMFLDVAARVGLLAGQDDASVSAGEVVKVWGGAGGVGWTLYRRGGGADLVEPRRGARGEGAVPAWVG